MSNETLKKPSEQIEIYVKLAQGPALELVRADVEAKIGRKPTDEEMAGFNATPDGQLLDIAMDLALYVDAIGGYLDSEAERRTAWEAKVEQAITELAQAPSEAGRQAVVDLFRSGAEVVKP